MILEIGVLALSALKKKALGSSLCDSLKIGRLRWSVCCSHIKMEKDLDPVAMECEAKESFSGSGLSWI